jgi:NADPH:quinone reductase-like Zn-dependent oxidoreductase
VTRFRPGDEVIGIGEGTFAEYAAVREDKLALKPVNLTFAHAAAVPISATTALQALRDKGHVQPGDHVLVIGASGGVGTFAVQLATAFGVDRTYPLPDAPAALRYLKTGHVRGKLVVTMP